MVKVLCGRPAFCFYCPLAATLAKPFWILDGVVQDEAYVNKVMGLGRYVVGD